MDNENEIVGVDFFDDAKLQNLVNAYLDNPPLVLYENIHFPHLPEGKVVGLVTIKPTESLTTLRKTSGNTMVGLCFLEREAPLPQEHLMWILETLILWL